MTALNLQVQNLGLEVGEDQWLLAEVGFTLPAGTIAGIVGPHGAGKSTLLRILSGLTAATTGEAILGDVDLVSSPAWARTHTGYVADRHGFYGEMATGEYLHFMAACHGIAVRERKTLVADLLELVDLTGAQAAPVSTLSHGMRQRLAVARALVHDPDLLLLDDPVTGLDPRSRLEFSDLLKELAGMGKSVLLCTADTLPLADLATYVGILSAGRLVAFGTRAEVSGRFRRTRVVEVRMGGSLETAAEMARAMPHVQAVSTEGPVLRVAHSGGDGAIQSLLANLIRSGLPVQGFVEDRGGLEEAFRQLTEG